MNEETETKILLMLGQIQADVRTTKRDVRKINTSVFDLYTKHGENKNEITKIKTTVKNAHYVWGAIVAVVGLTISWFKG